MKLTKLDIVNFRNYSKLSLDFSYNINILNIDMKNGYW